MIRLLYLAGAALAEAAIIAGGAAGGAHLIGGVTGAVAGAAIITFLKTTVVLLFITPPEEPEDVTDAASKWMAEHPEETAKHPGRWLAIHPEDGIVVSGRVPSTVHAQARLRGLEGKVGFFRLGTPTPVAGAHAPIGPMVAPPTFVEPSASVKEVQRRMAADPELFPAVTTGHEGKWVALTPDGEKGLSIEECETPPLRNDTFVCGVPQRPAAVKKKLSKETLEKYMGKWVAADVDKGIVESADTPHHLNHKYPLLAVFLVDRADRQIQSHGKWSETHLDERSRHAGQFVQGDATGIQATERSFDDLPARHNWHFVAYIPKALAFVGPEQIAGWEEANQSRLEETRGQWLAIGADGSIVDHDSDYRTLGDRVAERDVILLRYPAWLRRSPDTAAATAG